jgi:hypothetical protein
MQALVEVFAEDGRVVVSVCPADGSPVELSLEPDEARGLVNMIGHSILDACRTGALT